VRGKNLSGFKGLFLVFVFEERLWPK
jgi:hypothetical protein